MSHNTIIKFFIQFHLNFEKYCCCFTCSVDEGNENGSAVCLSSWVMISSRWLNSAIIDISSLCCLYIKGKKKNNVNFISYGFIETDGHCSYHDGFETGDKEAIAAALLDQSWFQCLFLRFLFVLFPQKMQKKRKSKFNCDTQIGRGEKAQRRGWNKKEDFVYRRREENQ